MKLFLCPNLFYAKQREQASACIAALERMGHQCALSESDSVSLFCAAEKAIFSAAESDLIVSVGGDGAVLRAAQVAIAANRPLFGVNGGRLGYLCALSLRDADKFDAALKHSRQTERSLLELTMDGTPHYAVNDVLFAKENPGASVELTVDITNQGHYHLRGDGLIIATPTGSTAYNRSAGGPVIDTRCRVLALTPLYTSMGSNRTIITGDENTVTVSKSRGDVTVIADGQTLGSLPQTLEIRRSRKTLFLYVPKQRGL